MKKSWILGIAIVCLVAIGSIFIIKAAAKSDGKLLTPLIVNVINSFPDNSKPVTPKSDLASNDVINILLLGIDRRSKQETGFRSDTMIMLSINKKDKIAVMTSVPRDLWVGNGRINALYASDGFDGIKNEFAKLTGQVADRYILSDFADFSWIVDAMDGVSVNVDRTFTDTQFPVDATFGY